MSSVYDTVIIGGGITGNAALYVLSRYTDIKRIAIFERQRTVAAVNSNTVNNSQTLHMGDIESNYDLAQALKVQEAAAFIAGYLAVHHPEGDGTCIVIPRMLLGVGGEEVETVRTRYGALKKHFPGLSLHTRHGIEAAEPMIVEGRKEKVPVAALRNDRGYAVDYRMLAESFRAQASKSEACTDTFLGTPIREIRRRDDGLYLVITDEGEVAARSVMVAAGSTSLAFAHALGYGREYMLLPVAGSFYLTGQVLNGKVYTVQNPKIPFAAVHGDPAVYNRRQTRFGPTARPMPILERHHWRTLREFMKTGGMSLKWFWNALRVGADKDIAAFLLKNLGYDLPFFGKRLFLRSARKIVPSLGARDIRLDRGAGGIRGQLVDTTTGALKKGMARIDGDGITFVFAPSPGASGALGNAVEVTRNIVGHLGDARFDEEGIRRDLLGPARDIGAIAG